MRKNGQYVLHRILKEQDGKYWIVGDNCLSGEMVNEEQILGVMTALKRGGRSVNLTGWRYRLYVRFWCAPYRQRFFVLRVKWFLYRCLRYVKRRIFG